MTAVFKREFKSYFTSPLGYVYLAIFLLFEGIFFYELYRNGSPDIAYLITGMATVIVFVTPVLTMRLLSEDRKQKVDQALLTAPVSVAGVVCGKFLAALTVYAIAFAPTLLFQLVVSTMVTVNWLFYLNALLGILLLGAAIISIGMFISSLTESQVISCVLTLVTFLMLMILPTLVSLLGWNWLSVAADYLAIFGRLENFSDGFFHIADVVCLLSFAVLFTFLTVRSVEKRRWA